jgi:hypothetical protein
LKLAVVGLDRFNDGVALLADLHLISNFASPTRHTVFIHGVRFSRKPVWMSSGDPPELWPRWLADEIPGLTVWSVEHNSAPTKWFGHAMPLVDRANNVLPRLLAEPRLAQGEIAFVTHSFGRSSPSSTAVPA